MPKKSAKKIILLSKILKYLSIVCIILFPLSNLIYWMFDISKIKLWLGTWYIQFTEMPRLSLHNLPIKMKVIGFAIDLIPTVFFILIFAILIKVARQYERLCFFSKENIRAIRYIAIILLCKILVYPFYLALRTYTFTPPGEDYVVNLFTSGNLKELLIIFSLLMFSYIKEAALKLEELLIGTV